MVWDQPGVQTMLIVPPALLLGDMDHLQPDGVLLPPVPVVDVEHHNGEVVIVVILLVVGLVLLPQSKQEVDDKGP